MNVRIKWLAGLVVLCGTSAMAQKKAPENWFNLDAQKDGVNGVSTEKVYQDLLKGKKGRTVVVAVIDGGVDAQHEDLKDIMWVNAGEIPNNGIDDDKNGYIDDIHGWNFLGGKDGRSVHHETLEATRLYGKLKAKFDNVEAAKVSKADKKDYDLYVKLKKEIEENLSEAKEGLAQMESIKTMYTNALDAVEAALAGQAITKESVKGLKEDNENLKLGKTILTKRLATGKDISSVAAIKAELMEQLAEGIDYYEGRAKYQYNWEFNPRAEIVKDNYADSNERFYGNNDVKGPEALHGTHVAGIIGAVRKNGIGMDGVADNVRIMGVRCVPDGDERDKDVANAIRYAVDNGAQVINMSFGKGYNWDKAVVDEAVKYAESKDVLLVHAAGNESKNTSSLENNFPNPVVKKKGLFGGKRHAKNWIEVGALSWKKDADMVAPFSNYSQTVVDVFAPGVDIYATAPDNTYKSLSGTSMASPVTAGVAAIIRSYYPELTAEQVKECIEQSAVKQTTSVKKPGGEEKVPFSTLSKTGGVVNAYEAVKMAAQMKGKKKVAPKA